MTTPRKQLANLFIDAGSDFSYIIKIPTREIANVTQWEFRSQFRFSSQNKDGYSFTTTPIHESGKNEVELSLTSDETATLEGGTYSYTVIGWEKTSDGLVPSDGRHRIAEGNLTVNARITNPYPGQGSGYKVIEVPESRGPKGDKGDKGDKGEAGITLPTLTNGQVWVGDSDGNPTASNSLANSITKNVIRDVGPTDANATASVTLPSNWASYNTMLLIFNNGGDVGNRYVPIDALAWYLTYTQSHSFRLAGQSDLTVSGNISSALTITHTIGSNSFTAGIYKCVLYNKTRITS